MFGLKQLLMFVSSLAIALALANRFPPVTAFLSLMALAAVAVFLWPPHHRRPFFYGGMAGIVLGLIACHVVLHFVYMDLPRAPIVYGPASGGTQPPQVQRDAIEVSRPYVITLGFVIGAACGIVFSGLRPMKLSRCHVCSRENAVTTRICPHCETRLDS